MKSTIYLVSILFLLFSGASYAANVGDIVGGYPAGYNPNNPGEFTEHIGEPIAVTFTPTTTAQSPDIGTMQGPFPAGFGYKPGTTTPSDEFLDAIDEREKVDREHRSISMKRSVLVKESSLDFTNNVTVVVTGNDPGSSDSIQYYVGYKLVTIAW
ncbi:MAG: hypothetical protein PHD29_02760 [bacterium]|nr:hypothetical protein [bacterium]MDD5756612.1 hypothetical protein [bacterium]